MYCNHFFFQARGLYPGYTDYELYQLGFVADPNIDAEYLLRERFYLNCQTMKFLQKLHGSNQQYIKCADMAALVDLDNDFPTKDVFPEKMFAL